MLWGVIMAKENLIGQKFGLLTVVGPADDYVTPKGYKVSMWKCQCECGAEVVTRGTFLKNGHTKGCGQKHRKYEDLVGKKFGKLTVLERVSNEILSNGHTQIKWRCQCECGNEVVTRGTSLKNGHTRSCGCAHSDGAMGVGLIDITGQKFGRWTVLYENGRLKDPCGKIVPLWHCRCDCGEERDLRAGTLKAGLSLSCGCFKYERLMLGESRGIRISRAEKIVSEFLQSYNVYYEPQKIYTDLRGKKGYPLSYDFLVYQNGQPFFLLECQGIQHYMPVDFFGGEKQFLVQKSNDKIKRRYAISKGIPLYEIPYTCKTEESIIQLLKLYLGLE